MVLNLLQRSITSSSRFSQWHHSLEVLDVSSNRGVSDEAMEPVVQFSYATPTCSGPWKYCCYQQRH